MSWVGASTGSALDPKPQLLEMTSSDVPCIDDECIDPETGRRSMAEPEQDSTHSYWSCPNCGSEFGYASLPKPVAVAADGTCALGVPEALRRAVSFDPSMAESFAMPQPEPQPLQIRRRR